MATYTCDNCGAPLCGTHAELDNRSARDGGNGTICPGCGEDFNAECHPDEESLE